MNRTTLCTLVAVLLASLGGCTKHSSAPALPAAAAPYEFSTSTGSGTSIYRVEPPAVTQTAGDADSSAFYGVISDIHGHAEKARAMGQRLAQRDADAILVLGDTPRNDALRYGRADAHDDAREITEALAALAESGLPVFVIPGNHETREAYAAAFSCRAPLTATGSSRCAAALPSSVVDMAASRLVDGDDADIVSIPGYQVRQAGALRLIPDNGYWAEPQLIYGTARFVSGRDDPVLLMMHGPPYVAMKDGPGPGTMYNGTDVGDRLTAQFMKEKGIRFAVAGHIHEAGGIGVTLNGAPVPEKTWSDSLVLNVGSIEPWRLLNGTEHKGMGAVVTINRTKAMYELMYLD